MTELKLGAATVQRIEESYEPNFDARSFFPDWQPSVVDRHRSWLVPGHYDEASGFLKLSVHSWLLTVGGKRILIDTSISDRAIHETRKQYVKNLSEWLLRQMVTGKAGASLGDDGFLQVTHDAAWKLAEMHYEEMLRREADTPKVSVTERIMADSIAATAQMAGMVN